MWDLNIAEISNSPIAIIYIFNSIYSQGLLFIIIETFKNED
jgi:hypothetical protein